MTLKKVNIKRIVQELVLIQGSGPNRINSKKVLLLRIVKMLKLPLKIKIEITL
jgi:hypothetical protein